jgi:hypothetical protein
MFSTRDEALQDFAKRNGVDWYRDAAFYVKSNDDDFDQFHWDNMIANGAEVLRFDDNVGMGELIAWVQSSEQRERCENAITQMKVINQRQK